jgi:hypothetical protein
MSTAPAGPLDGAARTRPDGWLPNPLTTNHVRAEHEARRLVLRHHPDAVGAPLRCLTARYRTATFALGNPPQRLFKRHADEAAYLGEVLAYQLLDGDRVLPALHSSCDASRTLVIDYIGRGADLADAHTFEELIRVVATVHTASSRWHPAVREAMAAWRTDTAFTRRAPEWISCSDAWLRLLHLVADAHGPGHVPVGHLDLKPDHARRHHDGHVLLIDAETLRPDLTGLPDLITLAYIAGSDGSFPSSSWVRRAYLHHVNDLGGQWTDRALIRALKAFATATGLHSVHGVQA